MSTKPRNLAEERLGASVSKPVIKEVPLPPPSREPSQRAVREPSRAPSPPPLPAGPHQPPPSTGGTLQQPLLFECAWEVCWQLGGIYTVLKTKSPAMQRRWDDRYFLIGPYNPATAAVEFEERPTDGWIRTTLDRLREAGMPCHFGQWLIPGRPKAILLDYRARFGNLHTDKYLMWKDHGISTDVSDGEVNEVIAFGFAVAEFFRNLTEVQPDRPVLAHFHEWMGGVAVPRIAHLKIPVTTIFTTHATLLGRYLASDQPDFYSNLDHIDPDREAARYNIYPRFAIERAAAHASTVFTTVSEVTAVEAEKLLGRPADVILPNGLNIQRFTALHEFQNLHREYKEKIHKFVMGHFFPSYTFDLDRTLYVFTSGRYEYRNKGMDMFIESLWRLNQRLRGVPDRPTVVAFIITRAATRNINVQVLQNQSMFEDLQNTCNQVEREMGEVLFRAAATGRMPTFQELLTQDNHVKLKRAMHAWRTNRQPTIVTHDLCDDANDPVLKHLRYRHMFNAADDPVKIVFHPEFATATSPLLNLDYEQFVRGCHVGLFPSYYEPWGYTPMESLALGVPAVTTDLSGFGAYVERHIADAESQGIKVLKRRWQGFDQCCDEMANYLFHLSQLSRRQRIELRNRVERLSEMFDWTQLAQHYHDAHQMALERMGASRAGSIDIRMV
ncbi:MAG: glycosyltransferase [Tepidisphaerales bacterium]